MLEFLIFILSSIGLTFIINFHYIFKWLRNFFDKINPSFLGKGIKCPACLGFWSGMFVHFIQMGFIFDLNILLYGFASSFICYLAYLIIKPLMDKYD